MSNKPRARRALGYRFPAETPHVDPSQSTHPWRQRRARLGRAVNTPYRRPHAAHPKCALRDTPYGLMGCALRPLPDTPYGLPSRLRAPSRLCGPQAHYQTKNSCPSRAKISGPAPESASFRSPASNAATTLRQKSAMDCATKRRSPPSTATRTTCPDKPKSDGFMSTHKS